ncbi:MopE-related protein, partial [Confluentibacter lentus]|uniref:MopE-related protein n=1 Tax=Confluentibacter lentus TaxID=1699412 RepID=UPI0012FE2087
STTSVTQCASPGLGYSTTAPATPDCNDNDDTINPDTIWYTGVDTDGDGFFGSTTSVTQCASPGLGYSTTAPATPDCNDNDDTINPDTIWYTGVDTDGDGFFGSTTSVTQCASPGLGYSTTAPATPDCNDNDDTINPDTIWYTGVDTDGDGFFGSTTSVTQCASPGASYSTTAPTTPDCNDNDDTINPDTIWYVGVDNDGDGFFGSTTSVTQCASPGAGYSTTAPATPDCNDNDDTINPDTIWYAGVDNDGDGFFGSTTSVTQCASPGVGYSTTAPATNDCDDNDSAINPGTTEIIGNGIDDDCNPATSDGSLSIDDFNLYNVYMSPNPFNHNIVIKIPLRFNNSEFNIKIFDLNGRLVFDKKYSSNGGTIHVNGLNNLQQAPYLLKMTSKETGESIVKRLIKY